MEVEITFVVDINRVLDLNVDKSFQGEKKRKTSQKCFQYMNTFFDKCWT